jgi:glycosyltransferase involved in cell wall biosynthesis
MDQGVWQVLDAGSIWMKEFASAMAKIVPTAAWVPELSYTGSLQNWERIESLKQPPLDILHFPLQRGYARAPLRWIAPFEVGLLRRLKARTTAPACSPLICSTPFYAPLAERWPGPTIYYVTDLTAAYEGINSKQVIALDRRMCKVAHAVCPNSSRIAKYLREQANCSPEKITIVPNATRESNLSDNPLLEPDALPSDIAQLRRPIAGVIGNLSANMDWRLLADAVRLTAHLTWVLVGPTTMPIADRGQAEARSWVMQHSHFTGPKAYGELQAYARCFDVAVLPYRKKEPTYSGSSTRYYEHLAACRPMVATRGFAELLEKTPLVELVDTAEELAQALKRLHAVDYKDGLEALRWQASRQGTWEERARALTATISGR